MFAGWASILTSFAPAGSASLTSSARAATQHRAAASAAAADRTHLGVGGAMLMMLRSPAIRGVSSSFRPCGTYRTYKTYESHKSQGDEEGSRRLGLRVGGLERHGHEFLDQLTVGGVDQTHRAVEAGRGDR